MFLSKKNVYKYFGKGINYKNMVCLYDSLIEFDLIFKKNR